MWKKHRNSLFVRSGHSSEKDFQPLLLCQTKMENVNKDGREAMLTLCCSCKLQVKKKRFLFEMQKVFKIENFKNI